MQFDEDLISVERGWKSRGIQGERIVHRRWRKEEEKKKNRGRMRRTKEKWRKEGGRQSVVKLHFVHAQVTFCSCSATLFSYIMGISSLLKHKIPFSIPSLSLLISSYLFSKANYHLWCMSEKVQHCLGTHLPSLGLLWFAIWDVLGIEQAWVEKEGHVFHSWCSTEWNPLMVPQHSTALWESLGEPKGCTGLCSVCKKS